jgi:hypothetical protein
MIVKRKIMKNSLFKETSFIFRRRRRRPSSRPSSNNEAQGQRAQQDSQERRRALNISESLEELPQNALEKLRLEAVNKSEREAKENPNENSILRYRNTFESLIDAKEELNYFFKNAVEAVKKYLKIINDPKIEEKTRELEAVLAKSDEFISEKAYQNEAMAYEYWQELMNIVEREDRMTLEHGEDLLKRLGVPNSVKLLEYEYDDGGGETMSRHYYRVEKDGINYNIIFYENGKILLDANKMARYESLRFFRSNVVNMNVGQFFSAKSVSLEGLKNGSVFEVFVHRGASELTNKLSNMASWGLGDLPHRSTNPSIKNLQRMRRRLFDFNEELSGGEYLRVLRESHLEKTRVLLGEVMRAYLDLAAEEDPSPQIKEILENFKKALIWFFKKYPLLAQNAFVKIANLEELKFFSEMDDIESYGILHQMTENRRVELAKFPLSRMRRLREYQRLPAAHKRSFNKLISAAALPTLDETETKQLLRDFRRIDPANLKTYVEFIFAKHKSIQNDTRNILIFTKYSRGIPQKRYEVYCFFCANHFALYYFLEGVAKILRHPHLPEDHLEILKYILVSARANVPVVKDCLRKIPLIISKGYSEDEIIKFLQEKQRESAKIIRMLATLDKDLIANHFKLILENFPDHGFDDFSGKMNALSPLHRKGLSYLVKDDIFDLELHSSESVIDFLDILVEIKNEAMLQFLMSYDVVPKSTVSAPDLFWALSHANKVSLERMQNTKDLADKYENVWKMINENMEKDSSYTIAKPAYAFLGKLMKNGAKEEELLKILPYLHEIQNHFQIKTIEAKMAEADLYDLVKLISEQNWKENFSLPRVTEPYYFKILNQGLPIEKIPELYKLCDRDMGFFKEGAYILRIFLAKTNSYEESFGVFEKLNAPEFKTRLEAVKRPFEQLRWSIRGLTAFYLKSVVELTDLDTPEKIFQGLSEFLKKTQEENYDHRTDPHFEKAFFLLNPGEMLEKESVSFIHLSFILNQLLGSSPEYSRENLNKYARRLLNSPKEVLREKGAKLLIGLGNSVRDFDLSTLKKIAQEGVDDKLSRHVLSDKIKNDHLRYLKRRNAPNLPLSLYFSILINLENNRKSGDLNEFKRLVDLYGKIENEPVYEGKLLILAHDKNDSTHSHIFANDSFNTNAHEVMAKQQGIEAETIRHNTTTSSVDIETMFSHLEEAEGDLTLVVGGHGGHDIISFGAQHFNMDEFFERLAKRLDRQRTGANWKTSIIFESCHSAYNSKILLRRWESDPRTKGHPVRMLSSSNEDEGSAKMANDSWEVEARRCKNENCTLTWGDLYRNIESKNFVMSQKTPNMFDFNDRMNSNMTLFINGDELG